LLLSNAVVHAAATSGSSAIISVIARSAFSTRVAVPSLTIEEVDVKRLVSEN